MEALKQRLLEHIADLLDEPTFELDMRLADCIDKKPREKSELHLIMADIAFKAFCTYFNKQDNSTQWTINDVSQQRELLIDFAETYQNCHLDDTAENTVDWYLRIKDN